MMKTIAREYLSTHPFLTFSLDMKEVPHTTWMLLAEAQTMGKQIAGVPLLPSVATAFQQLYLANGVLATTAIEGNTLTEGEVVQLLNGALNLPPSREYLGQEINNIVEACNQILERLFLGAPISLAPDDIVDINRFVLQDLPLNSEVVPGNIREHSLRVGNYRAAPPEDLNYLLERLCSWLNEDFAGPPRYMQAFAILKAIVAHVYLAWIRPFADGNGRTARLVEFQILLSCGLPGSVAHLLSNHYNQTRSQYHRQIEVTHRNNGDILPFIDYAGQCQLDLHIGVN
jgi:Fic family protein